MRRLRAFALSRWRPWAVGLHVEGDDARRAAAAGRPVGDLQAGADAGELDVEQVRVHEGGDTTGGEGVRSQSVSKMAVQVLARAPGEGDAVSRMRDDLRAAPDREGRA